MTDKTSITDDPTSTDPVFLRESDAVAFVIPVSGVVTSITSPTATYYQEGQQTDKASTYWTGSMSISGVDTIITKTTQALKAGNWILSVSATVDGVVQNVCTIPIIIKRRSER
jgi:hypothetical protein